MKRAVAVWRSRWMWGEVPPADREHWVRFRIMWVFVVLVCPALAVIFINTPQDWLIAVAIVAGLGLAVLIEGRRRR